MGTIRIIKTMPGEANFAGFEQVLSKVYSGQILELKKRESLPTAHLKSCLILLKNDEPVARLAIYLNPFFEKTVLFGGYECVDDLEISRQILEAGKEVVYSLINSSGDPYGQAGKSPDEKGFRIIGPMNGSTWENYRFVLRAPLTPEGEPPPASPGVAGGGSPLGVRGAREPFFLEPTQPNHYLNQWQSFDFQLFTDYRSDFRDNVKVDFKKLEKWENHFQKQGIELRGFDKNNADSIFKNLAKFNLEAFKNNFLFSPISELDFVEKYRKSLPLIDPELVWLAWENDEIVGMVFCLPNMLSPEPFETLILKTLAAKEGFRYRGLGNLLYMKSISGGAKKGAKNVIHALMKNDNISVNVSKKFEAVCFRKYGLFEKILNS